MSRLDQLAQMSREELLKRVSDLESTRSIGGNSLKVGEKGGVSLYGLGRFPVTLYAESWMKLFEKTDEIKQFIVANQASLKFKRGIPEFGIPATEQAAE